MMILVAVFLLAFYIAKIFFPSWFVLQIQNESLVKIGTFIDSHWWMYSLCSAITSFIAYSLYVLCIKQKLFINWIDLIIILSSIIVGQLVYWFAPQHYNTVSFLILVNLPMLCSIKSKVDKQFYIRSVVVFSIHTIFQLLSLNIRGIINIINTYNYMTLFLMTLEAYFWLLLMYFYFNYNKISQKGV